MKACVFSSFMSILVNGSPTEDFIAHKGFRQGDILSHFPFLVVADGLVGLFNKSIHFGSYSGFEVANGHSLSLLRFNDDTIMVGKGTWTIFGVSKQYSKALS